MAVQIPSYIVRMEVERADIESFKDKLDDRIKKLDEFIKTDKFKDLNFHQKDLLDMQLVHMKNTTDELSKYYHFLNERISNEKTLMSVE